MPAADHTRVAEMRAAFFQRTRKPTLVFYVALAASAVAAAAFALARDSAWAAGGIAVGLLAAIGLFAASPLFSVSPRAARAVGSASAVAGVLAATLLDATGSVLATAPLWGAFSGFMAGTIVGIARIRKRLAWDDELLLRQKRLGFDPQDPYGWMRRE